MDIFSTHVLAKVVEYLPTPSSFLLDMFFPQVQTSDKEEIFFDVTSSKPRISPFVSPYMPGKVVNGGGYQTKSFKPAYVKDKRRFDANVPFKRLAGETIGGSFTPKQRYERAIATTLQDQLDNLTRREEVMAAEVLRTGQVIISGEGYPSQTVNFGRDISFTKALTGTNAWAAASTNPLDNLETWAGDVQSKSGVVAKTVVMDPEAWKVFRSNPFVEKYLVDLRRGTNNSLNVDPMVRGKDSKARYVGAIGDFDLYVYNDVYLNDEGVETKLLPAKTVILGSKDGLEGTRCYGAIHDERADFLATRYFPKSWLEEDPAVRWLLLQSAPLVVPYRPNASMCVTIG
ncbi:MAG: major capsid protein [Alphaproteobacteria bacterium]